MEFVHYHGQGKPVYTNVVNYIIRGQESHFLSARPPPELTRKKSFVGEVQFQGLDGYLHRTVLYKSTEQ